MVCPFPPPPLTVYLHIMCALIWAPRDGPNYMCGCATSTVSHLRKSRSSITLSHYSADSGPRRPRLDLLGSEALPTVPATLYKLVQLQLRRLWLTWRGVRMTMLTGSLKVRRSGSEQPQFWILNLTKWSRYSQYKALTFLPDSHLSWAVCACECLRQLAQTVLARRCSRKHLVDTFAWRCNEVMDLSAAEMGLVQWLWRERHCIKVHK